LIYRPYGEGPQPEIDMKFEESPITGLPWNPVKAALSEYDIDARY